MGEDKGVPIQPPVTNTGIGYGDIGHAIRGETIKKYHVEIALLSDKRIYIK